MARTPKPWFWKKRGAWFVTIDGCRHNLGPDKDDAIQLFHELMAKPQKRAVSSDSVLGIIDAFLDWTKRHRAQGTYDWYLGFCQSFSDSIPASLRVTALKPYHVQNWLDARNGDSQSTKRACVTAVKRAFHWAEQQGYIDRSPIAHIEKPQAGTREQVVSSKEYESIVSEASDEEFRELVTTAWEIGPRPQELVRVEARHVDLGNSRWVFPKQEAKIKTHPRVVYLTKEALEITKRRMAECPDGPLFRNVDGKPWNKSAVNSRFVRLRKKVGKKYCLYAFRHSFATRLLEAGVDSLTVAILLGHQDPSMLAKVYQHLGHNPQHLLEQVRRAVG